jgi:hypothetical protein
MRVWQPVNRLRGYAHVLAVAGLALGLVSCGLDKQEEPPPVGPSDRGISTQLVALPDVLNADGVSRSVVQLTLREQNGNPAEGRAVWFLHDGDGKLVPSAASTYVGPLQEGFVMATDANGVAAVIYVAGRQQRRVEVIVRPYSIDATAGTALGSVQITQD